MPSRLPYICSHGFKASTLHIYSLDEKNANVGTYLPTPRHSKDQHPHQGNLIAYYYRNDLLFLDFDLGSHVRF